MQTRPARLSSLEVALVCVVLLPPPLPRKEPSRGFVPQSHTGEMAGAQHLKHIPRIKFPQRHPKPASSGSGSQVSSSGKAQDSYALSSEVPAPPKNTAVGGKASLQPKRTPVSDREIEAILLGGCF